MQLTDRQSGDARKLCFRATPSFSNKKGGVPVINWFVRYATLHDFRLLLWCNEIFIVVGYYALHVGSALLELQGILYIGN